MSDPTMREGFGRALAEYGEVNSRVLVLDNDSSVSTCSVYFGQKYPDRFFNFGLTTASMLDVAAGLSLGGFVPVVNGFAAQLTRQAYEQIYTSVCLADLNIKIVGSSAGISNIRDGAPLQMINDLAVMRSLPGMTVIVPSDAKQAAHFVPLVCELQGPVYLRISRAVSLPVSMPNDRIIPGNAIVRKEGKDVAIIATGLMVGRSMIAAVELERESISAAVLEVHTVKPIDSDAILKLAVKCGALVSAEEHSMIGGLGSTIAELLTENWPIPLQRVGLKDMFADSAQSSDTLFDHVGLSVQDIQIAAKKALKIKKST
jgi:transketolase